MTTNTNKIEKRFIDVTALRDDLIALLERTDEALSFDPSPDTVVEYSDRLWELQKEVKAATDVLSYASTVLGMLTRVGDRLKIRGDNVAEVFHRFPDSEWEIRNNIHECRTWGKTSPTSHKPDLADWNDLADWSDMPV